jgi:hypothetical protein
VNKLRSFIDILSIYESDVDFSAEAFSKAVDLDHLVNEKHG